MPLEKPLGQKGSILKLPFERQPEEIPHDLAATVLRATVAGPSCTVTDINVVVDRYFVARSDVVAGDEV